MPCAHGVCVGHEPDWKEIRVSVVPNPLLVLGRLTYWTIYCCEAAMKRMKHVLHLRCKVCGAEKEVPSNHDLALCSCCGKKVPLNDCHDD